MLVVPRSVLLLHAQLILGNEPWVMRLFVNDRIPSSEDSAWDYVEPSALGYSPARLRISDWEIKEGDEGELVLSAPLQVFSFREAAGSIYGYYYTQEFSGKMIGGVERFFDGPKRMLGNEDILRILPRYVLTSGRALVQ